MQLGQWLVAIVAAAGTAAGTTTAHVGALGDSTPFTEFADTSYASLSSFASHGAQTEAACMKMYPHLTPHTNINK